MPSVEQSRRILLDAVGDAPEMVLVRPIGNVGDDLIWAGAQELFSAHIHREITVEEIASESGELAVICGGGGWCAAHGEYMPEVLAIAEMRFSRVIVLPSTFDASVARVRAALERSRATIFARELDSYEQIRDLCDARLAHDCAFFLTLPEMPARRSGTLNAFRLDAERNDALDPPPDNNDISSTSGSLEQWLETIAAHEVVNTNRAHVMIAAARMGLRVNYAPGNYFKVDSIARSCLGGYDVHRVEGAPAAPAGHLRRPAEGVAVGDAGDPQAAITAASELPGVRHLLLLADGQRPRPGAIEALSEALAANPSALAAAPAIVGGDGRVLHCGGWILEGGEDLAVEYCERGGDPSELGGSAELAGWAPLGGSMFRLDAFGAAPPPEMSDRGCRDIEWSLRARAAAGPGAILRVPEATLEDGRSEDLPTGSSIVLRAPRAARLVDHARLLFDRGALVPAELRELMPELCDAQGDLDAARARLLLQLVAARGPEWTLMEWINGGLRLLLDQQRTAWLEARNETLNAIEAGGWWRLRGRLLGLSRLVKGK